jgi:predicted nuclease of predicted toxin-antitoxin system
MQLYMDENVQQAITDGLRRRGVDVLTAKEDGYRHRPDPDVLDLATQLGRPLYTQDKDLLAEANRRMKAGISLRLLADLHLVRDRR